ncbi:MAG: hypothetical protein Q9169_008163 [Polycauliona sp. 2 TL-2023]
MAAEPSSCNVRVEKRNDSLMGLPSEILDTITELLSRVDKANLAATNKAVKAYVEPKIWSYMVAGIVGTPRDTAGLVDFLTSRPDIAPMVKQLSVDEYHPIHTRRLLSIQFPNMWAFCLQHEANDIQQTSERTKRELNKGLVQQPKLRTFIFWINPLVGSGPYSLSKADAALFRQPAVTRFRLHYTDFSVFESLEEAYFTNTNFNKFDLESSNYTPEALDRFVSSARNMKEMNIQHFKVPLDISHYKPILSRFTATLKALRLTWRGHTPGDNGMDLTPFSALRLLRIQPSTLLGPGANSAESYTTGTNRTITELVRSRIPAGLKILLLESVSSPPPAAFLLATLSPRDREFIRCLIEQRKSLAPRLKHIYLFYKEEMAMPDDLVTLAEEHEMSLFPGYHDDVIAPTWDVLDADSYESAGGDVLTW